MLAGVGEGPQEGAIDGHNVGIGPEPFMFASDFPHEIALDNCMEEIDEILERDDLLPEHKPLLLGENARRFYKLPVAALSS